MSMVWCHKCWNEVGFDAIKCGECGAEPFLHNWLSEPLKGKTLQGGKYRIIAPIGSGGFGSTVRAVQYSGNVNLGMVAIKFPLSNYARTNFDETSLSGYLEEAAALRSITHPNIVTLYDAFVENGTPYLVMEHVPGCNFLYSHLHSFSRNPSFFFTIFIQIGSAIDQLHTKGVLHCDLKPDNIGLLGFMGGHENFAKILDFGLAVKREGRKAWGAKGAGTAGFTAPEQFNGSPTPRSDVFSFGVLMYLALTGRLPYEWDNGYREPDANTVDRFFPDYIPQTLRILIRECIELREPIRFPRIPTEKLRSIAVANNITLDWSCDWLTDSREQQTAIIKEAKELFSHAGFCNGVREKRTLYAQAAKRFDDAAELGPIPPTMVEFARKALMYSGDKKLGFANIERNPVSLYGPTDRTGAVGETASTAHRPPPNSKIASWRNRLAEIFRFRG